MFRITPGQKICFSPGEMRKQDHYSMYDNGCLFSYFVERINSNEQRYSYNIVMGTATRHTAGNIVKMNSYAASCFDKGRRSGSEAMSLSRTTFSNTTKLLVHKEAKTIHCTQLIKANNSCFQLARLGLQHSSTGFLRFHHAG